MEIHLILVPFIGLCYIGVNLFLISHQRRQANELYGNVNLSGFNPSQLAANKLMTSEASFGLISRSLLRGVSFDFQKAGS